MTIRYHLDPDQYSLEAFQHSLSSREMIPSRVVLKEELPHRFQLLADQGIASLGDLLVALKTKAKREKFSEETGLPVEYLTVLNREAKSYLPNPVRLNAYAGISPDLIEVLQQQGITHSRHLYLAAARREDRMILARELGVSFSELTELLCLADLSRLYGFGPVFSRLMHDVGIRTVEALVGLVPDEIIRIYERETGRKADFSPGEIQFSLDLADLLDLTVEL